MKGVLRLGLATCFLLLSPVLIAQRTTTRNDETANNTSGCGSLNASYISAAPCTHTINGVTTPAVFPGARDDSSAGSDVNLGANTVIFDAFPANVADFAHDGVDIHEMVYQGFATSGKIFANILLWHDGVGQDHSSPAVLSWNYTPKAPAPPGQTLFNGHFMTGYSSHDSNQVASQMSFMQRLNIDGIVGNPPGPLPPTMPSQTLNNQNVNNAMQLWIQQADLTPSFLYSIMTDQQMWRENTRAGCGSSATPDCVERIMICSLDFMNTSTGSSFTCALDGATYSGGGLFADTHYWKVSSHPVVSYFIDEANHFSGCTSTSPCAVYNDNQPGTTCTNTSDCWDKVFAGINHRISSTSFAVRPFIIHRDTLSKHSTLGPDDGSFRWFNPSTNQAYQNFGPDTGTPSVDTLGYDGWLSQALTTTHPVALAVAFGKVDHAQSPFSQEIGDHKIMDAQCGLTWVQSFGRPAIAGFGTSHPLEAVEIATWDDYDEGTEVETGIDNCVGALSENLTGTTLSWSIKFKAPGTEDTIDHYSIFYSTDQVTGEALTWLADIPKNSPSTGTYTFTLPTNLPGPHTVVYVKAVGKSLIKNHLILKSGSVIYSDGIANTVSFGALQQWESSFSDDHGWNLSQYGSTMMFADLNGDGKVDVCGRGGAGIFCELSNGTSFGSAFLALNQFTDQQGWNQSPYYASIRLADVNGDGVPDVCGRGSPGIICALGDGTGSFGTLTQWDTSYSDAQGWAPPEYATTVMLADLNGDGKADVCMRSGGGISCELSNGNGFGSPFLALNQFRDDQGWNVSPYYGSLRLADINGDGIPDVCGRGSAGILCALGDGTGHFGALQQWESTFSDSHGWGLAQYGTTIMFADIDGDGKADACGRGSAGISCELSQGNGFGTAFLAIGQFRDDQGWGTSPYYNSLRLADVNGDGRPEVCGRGTAGVICAPWHIQ